MTEELSLDELGALFDADSMPWLGDALEHAAAAPSLSPPLLGTATSSSSSGSMSSSGGGGGGGGGGGAQTSSRAARNRDACQRHREKRRAEEQTLRLRNGALEGERDVFLSRIAELQSDVQALRFAGAPDLAKENALLRAEIRKHKLFLRTILDATHSAPSVLAEEQLRILHACMDAGLGHAVGLLYTSAVWQSMPPFELAPGRVARVRYQLLPAGCTLQTAKRLNLRTDLGFVPAAPRDLAERVRAFKLDAQRSAQALRRVPGVPGDPRASVERAIEVDALPEQLLRAAAGPNAESDVHVRRYVERRSSSSEAASQQVVAREAMLVFASCARQLTPRAFLLSDATSDADGAGLLAHGCVPCHVTAATSCVHALREAQLLPVQRDMGNESESGAQGQPRRLTESMLDATLVAPHGSDAEQSFLTHLTSVPVGFFHTLSSCEGLISPQGSATPHLVARTRVLWELVEQHALRA